MLFTRSGFVRKPLVFDTHNLEAETEWQSSGLHADHKRAKKIETLFCYAEKS